MSKNTEKMVVIGDLVEVCAHCDQPFTQEEWDKRHWAGEDRKDVHEACCDC